jgi:hypothetical protein
MNSVVVIRYPAALSLPTSLQHLDIAVNYREQVIEIVQWRNGFEALGVR